MTKRVRLPAVNLRPFSSLATQKHRYVRTNISILRLKVIKYLLIILMVMVYCF